MSSTMVKLALGGLFLSGGLAWGQGAPQAQTTHPANWQKSAANRTTKQATPSLDEMLAKALKNNPDIRVAEAKLREAEANLNQARLQVAQKAVQLHQELEAARALVKATEASAQRAQRLSQTGATPQSNLDQAQANLIAAKAKLASLEAQVPYLMGSPPHTRGLALADDDNTGRLAILSGPVDPNGPLADVTLDRPTVRDNVRAVPTGNLAEQIRKALDAPAGGEFQNVPLGQALHAIEDKQGISFIFRENLDNTPINLRVAPKTPFVALLEAIEDITPVRFVVRDYGILVVPADSVPPGAVSVRDFWKKGLAPRRQDAKKTATPGR